MAGWSLILCLVKTNILWVHHFFYILKFRSSAFFGIVLSLFATVAAGNCRSLHHVGYVGYSLLQPSLFVAYFLKLLNCVS